MVVGLLAALVIQSSVTPALVQQARDGTPAIRSALDTVLIDYPGSRFRDVYVTINLRAAEPRRAYFCGLVNGKNRMGGYTGWRPFMAMADGDGGIVNIQPEDEPDIVVEATCGRGGSHISDPSDRSDWLTQQ